MNDINELDENWEVISAAELAAYKEIAWHRDELQKELAALRAKNLELVEEVKHLSVEIVKIKQDLFAEEKRGDMHAELNRRSAKALDKPFEGDGSSWHDIPECVAALRARVEAAERERDELREALKPFAKLAHHYTEFMDEFDLNIGIDGNKPISFTVGDIRRAAALRGSE